MAIDNKFSEELKDLLLRYNISESDLRCELSTREYRKAKDWDDYLSANEIGPYAGR